MRIATLFIVASLGLVAAAWADGPADNVPGLVRPIPPVGIDVPADDRAALESGLAALGDALARLRGVKDAKVAALVPDVAIFDKAVRDALTHREFFGPKDITKARALLAEGRTRADALLKGESPWASRTGLVVRGHVSKIDGSVQPYGLVIPESYGATGPRLRLDLWFHGRGETLSEVNFLDERAHQAGTFAPADTIVLHPYGRYCNANKFAGEVDALEALDSVRERYRIDDERVSVRGFSMGGASTWQMAAHYSDRWFAANPGAGFCESARFLDVFQREKVAPPWYERTLWALYDCDVVAANLRQVPTVAYSGELDGQKQAADVMAEAMKREGVELAHVIGPATKHAYHPESRREVDRRLDSLAVAGRDRAPRDLHFVTYTLRYDRMNWLTVDAMGEHWSPARVDARVLSEGMPATRGVLTLQPTYLELRTSNVTALTVDFPAGTSPFRPTRGGGGVVVLIDGQNLVGPFPSSDDSWRAAWIKEGGQWRSAPASRPPGLAKRHGLQGPIDDAFLDSFLIVRPTGTARSPRFAAWALAEMDRAIVEWRRQFRGLPRVKDDSAVVEADIASSNLILWGDAESNSVLKRVSAGVPIGWRGDRIVVGDRSFPADGHAAIAIYPNPLNPARYVVFNSGFTFREYDYLNNARQTPKLPDWAVIDLATPPDSRHPGKVVDADFFGERWEVRPPHVDGAPPARAGR